MDHRCLIVDDSPTYCAAVRDMLEAAGMTVVATAATLAEAVEAANTHRPDLALVDIDLGAESGFDVVEALQKVEVPTPAVILVSTHDPDDFAEMIADSSAIGFLQKFGLSAELIAQMVAGHPRN
ncbi:response regulator transcription factor [Kineosporia rhizophila]|uniref:response regulator n=1 Tax=Kineosporia TaxID=49184 RepID=UPI000A7E221F|nr:MULTISPECIES: response regulator transcription factor [Kineosporia]MCE0535337.1 response regulator transcription factor [Kineosporia rhizophila]GLY16883.1 response regulator [Kineosporia sp. NBRC 101677]